MGKIIEFEVDGRAVSKLRPRVTRGGKHTYTPPKTINYEHDVAWACKQVFYGQPLKGPVRLEVVIHYRPAKGTGKSILEHLARAHPYHTKRPDLVNVVAAVQDGLNGVGYVDDKQVAVIHAQKVEDSHNFVKVRLYAIEQPG